MSGPVMTTATEARPAALPPYPQVAPIPNPRARRLQALEAERADLLQRISLARRQHRGVCFDEAELRRVVTEILSIGEPT